MTGKVFLNLAILCGILSQTINATFSGKDESSDINDRNRRVIHQTRIPRDIGIREVPSLVRIKNDGRDLCLGSILSAHVVLTVGHGTFFNAPVSTYKVYSGNEHIIEGQKHNVTRVQIYHTVTLLTVTPPFRFTRNQQPTQIYNHALPHGALAATYEWGNNIGSTSQGRRSLRKIVMPILNYKECAPLYKGQFIVRENHICTRDPTAQRHVTSSVYGAPLIYLDKLVGVYLWSEKHPNHVNPDVYINLLIPEIRSYINEYTQRIEAQY